HAFTAVDAGQRRRNPAGLQRVRRVRAAADEAQVDADVARGLCDRRLDVVLVGVRTPELEAGHTSHAVPQRPHAPGTDVDPVDMEELDVGDGAAVDLLEDLVRFRTLDLEAVMRAVDRLAVRAAVGAGIVREPYLVRADCRLESHPV